jgi:hypothetical protein
MIMMELALLISFDWSYIIILKELCLFNKNNFSW